MSTKYINTAAGVVLAIVGVAAQKWGVASGTADALIGAGLALCGTGQGGVTPAPAPPAPTPVP